MIFYKRIFLIIITVLLLTGCEQSDFSIEIHSDKSLDFEQIIPLDDKEYNTYATIYKLEGNVSRKEFTYGLFNEKGRKGLKIVANLDNIDDYVSSAANDVDITSYPKIFNEKLPLFKKNNFILFEKYTADFVSNTMILEKIIHDLNEIESDQGKYTGPIVGPEGLGDVDDDLAKYTYNINIGFPSNKDINLVIKGQTVEDINFSFIIFNPAAMVIFISIVSIGIVALLLVYKKKKLNNLIDATTLRESLYLDDYKEERKPVDPYSEGGAIAYNPALFNYGRTSTTISPYDNQKTIDELIDEYDNSIEEKKIVPLNDIKDPDFKMINEGKMMSINEMGEIFKSKVNAEEIANNDEYDPLNELYNRKEIQRNIEAKLNSQISEEKKVDVKPKPIKSQFISTAEVKPEAVAHQPKKNVFVSTTTSDNSEIPITSVTPKKSVFIDVPDGEEVKANKLEQVSQKKLKDLLNEENDTFKKIEEVPQEPPKNKFIN